MGSLVLAIDSIEIIDSIPQDEMQTGRHLYEHIRDLRTAIDDAPWTVARHVISSQDELTKTLTDLAVAANLDNRFPLIHLECHGASDHIQLSNGDRVCWSELAGPLRNLNRATRNRLIAVWAACNGIHSVMSIVGGFTKGTPVRLIIGFGEEVMAGKLVDAMKDFYSSLTTHRNVDTAVQAAEKVEPSIRLFKAEDAFTHAYIEVLRNTNAQSRNAYVEELVTTAKKHPPLKNRPRIHHDVRSAIQRVNPNSYFERAKRTFFMLGDFPELEHPLSFLTFDHVSKLANS